MPPTAGANTNSNQSRVGNELPLTTHPVPLTDWAKPGRFRFSLLSFLLFTCFAGATIGIIVPLWFRERTAHQVEQADLTVLLGTWVEESSGFPTAPQTSLVITGEQFLWWPTANYGTISINAKASPRTISFSSRDAETGQRRGMTCAYKLEPDRFTLQLLGGTMPDGSYGSLTSPHELVFVRMKTPPKALPLVQETRDEGPIDDQR